MGAVALLMVAATACKRPLADALVVVTVDAAPALVDVALLHTESMAGGQTTLRDVGADAAPFALGGGSKKTFGVDVAASIRGVFAIHVEARDAVGSVLAAGDGSTTLVPGMRADIAVTLIPPPKPVISAQPIYIGSGGTAATATQQLSLNTGGSDTVGSVAAGSGATITFGGFAFQTE